MQEPTEALVDEYLELVLSGAGVDVETFLASKGEVSSERKAKLRSLAAALDLGRDLGGTRAGPAAAARRLEAELPTEGSAGSAARPEETFGSYQLLRELGRGGQGVVYLARDTRFARRVALKILNHPGFAALVDSSPSGPAARMRREAEIASMLDHPGICVVHEMGEHSGRPYIAMRFVEGETLARRIARARERGEVLVEIGGEPPGARPQDGAESRAATRSSDPSSSSSLRRAVLRVVLFVEHAARALHAAHQAGVVHRDVKPGNIMVTPEGEPVLLDFGLARDTGSDAASITLTGEIFGSPPYMSPEQLAPQGGGASRSDEGARSPVDRRTDVYSLGVVLYECLTLRRPFDHPTRDGIYRAVLLDEPTEARRENPAIPRDLQVVLATAMEKDRDRRYRSALDFAEDLRRVRELEPIRARPTSPFLRARRWSQRNPFLATTMAAIFVMLGAGLWLQTERLREQNEQVLKERAAARRILGTSLLASSSAALATDTALALLLAVEGAKRQPGLLANNALYKSLAEMRELRSTHAAPEGLILGRIAPELGWAATISRRGVLRIWDLTTWTRLGELHVPDNGPCLDFSRDGRWLAAGSEGNSVRIADTRTWTWVRELGPHPGLVHAVAIDPEGRSVLGSCGQCSRLTRLDTGAETEFVQSSDLSPNGALSPDGAYALVAFEDALCTVAVASGEKRKLEGTRIWFGGAFSADGRQVVAVTGEQQAGIFATASGEKLLDLRSDLPIAGAGFSREGRHAFVWSPDGRVSVHDAGTGLESAVFTGHAMGLSGVISSPDGQRALSASGDGTARLWETRTGAERAVFRGHVEIVLSASFDSRDPERVITASADGTLKLWDVQSFSDRNTSRLGTGLISMAVAPDGSRLACSSFSRLLVVDLDGQRVLYESEGSGGPLNWVDWSPSGRTIVTASGDGTVQLWDATTGRPTADRFDHPSEAWCASFSPDGQRLVTACKDGLVRIFDVGNRALVRTLSGHTQGVRCTRYSPDGQRILSTSEHPDDRSIRIWDAETGEPGPVLRATDEHSPSAKRPIHASFSPDGRRIVAACWDGTARVWDVDEGSGAGDVQPTLELQCLEIVPDASFDPRGTMIATCSWDRRIRVWRAADGALLAELPPDARADPLRVSFTPDGEWILCLFGSLDSSIHRWPVDPLEAALARKPRDLTAAERVRYEIAVD